MRGPGRLLAALALFLPSSAQAVPPPKVTPVTIGRVCHLIAASADRHEIPRDFFARLIWKESRFDPDAVSPAGAEGIAQFMPGTADMRGLSDSFDVGQALPASAAYLAELKDRFGNLGLAAAAYNSGETRVSRWLARGGFLPLETENYVLDIMGEPVESFAEASYTGSVTPLAREGSFSEACRALPFRYASMRPMSRIALKPWGVQVAGNFRRSAAIRQFERIERRMQAILSGYEPAVSRVRSPRGRGGLYVVRLGAENRAAADLLCQKLRAAGGSCIVMRNR